MNALSPVPLLRGLLGHPEKQADSRPRVSTLSQDGYLALNPSVGLVTQPSQIAQSVGSCKWIAGICVAVGGEVEQGFLGGFALLREHASRVVDPPSVRQAALTIGANPMTPVIAATFALAAAQVRADAMRVQGKRPRGRDGRFVS